MKNDRDIKRTLTAILLLLSMLLAPLVTASCGSDGPRINTEEVPDNMKSEERKKAREDISEEDRAAYVAKLDQYADYLNGNFSLATELFPEDYWKAAGMTPEEFIEKQEESSAKNRQETVQKYGEGYKLTYKIDSENNYSMMLESLKSTLEEKYGISPDRVSKSYNIHIIVTLSGPKNKSTDSYYLFMTNIDDKWYAVNESGGFN